MSCEGFQEDLEALALRALDSEAEARLKAHILTCIDCESRFQAYAMAAEQLSLVVPMYAPPGRLKERIMGAVEGGKARRHWIPSLRSPWVGAAAAVVVIGLAIGAVAWAMTLSSELTRLHNDNQVLADEVTRLGEDNNALEELAQLDSEQRFALLELQGDLTSAKNEQEREQERLETTLEEQATLIVIALDPDLIPTELTGNILAPDATCNYVWSTQQSLGALTCSELPLTSLGLAYELWATKGDTLVRVANFLPDVDGTAQLLIEFPEEAAGPVTDLWITLERDSATGRTEPEGVVVLSREPDQQVSR